MEKKPDFSITISEFSDQTGQISATGELNWPHALIMLSSAIRHFAYVTADQITEIGEGHWSREEVLGDIADMINNVVSNILNEISPKDPDLQLSEVAIATMENEIIHKAQKEHKPIKEALKEYQDNLLATSDYPATPSDAAPEVFKKQAAKAKPALKLLPKEPDA